MQPDPKPEPTVRDSALLRQLHVQWQECAVCMGTAYSEGRLSLHHILKHPRDDLRGNLVMLCGDGTRGCHGRVEARDQEICGLLGLHIIRERPDTIQHLLWRLGSAEAASDWLQRQLWVTLSADACLRLGRERRGGASLTF